MIKLPKCNKNDEIQPFDEHIFMFSNKKKKVSEKEQVVCKSPMWFLENVAKDNDYEAKYYLGGDKVEKYAKLMEEGEKFPTPVYKGKMRFHHADGAHRAAAAHMIGLKKIPIVVDKHTINL